jgi:hypothetical protein
MKQNLHGTNFHTDWPNSKKIPVYEAFFNIVEPLAFNVNNKMCGGNKGWEQKKNRLEDKTNGKDWQLFL